MYATMSDVEHVATGIYEGQEQWPAYDHTRLVAVSTCPTWGLVRYVHHKTMGKGRAMALEAGGAAHDVYAAARIWQLWKVQGLYDHAMHHGKRIFGEERLNDMCHVIDETAEERVQYLNFCLQALHNSGFYDDPSDKRRTVSAVEESCIAWLDRYDMRRLIYVENVDDPTALVGIEIPIDVGIVYTMTDGSERKYRFVGRADGVRWYGDNLTIEENKTASRLGDAWATAFLTSHQVTGYMMGTSAIIRQPVRKAVIMGMAIPLPRTYDYGGLMNEHVSREPDQFYDFLEWFLNTAQVIEQWEDKPWAAPKYTHSCNRYFRACSLIPFCGSPMDDRKEMLQEMETDEWNPLEEVENSA